MEENNGVLPDRDGTQSVPEDDMPRDRTTVSARWASALRRLMDQQGITQLELAALAGIDKDTVTNIMRGDSSSTATMEKLAQALGVDISELALTAEQSRVLAEHRLRADDRARRISRQLATSGQTETRSASAAVGLPADQDSVPEALQWPAYERRSGQDRRKSGDGRSGQGRRSTNERNNS